MSRFARSWPLVAFILVGGFAIAQSTPAGRKFPYAGFLEENGAAVTGARAVQMRLFTSDSTTTVCDTQSFASVDVVAGRFAVTLAGVPDACLTTGELFVEISVGPVGGTLTALSTGSGSGRAQIAATPFASAIANAQGFMAGSANVVFDRLNGQSRIGTSNGATAIVVQPLTDIGDGNAVLSVRSFEGVERLRVEENNVVTVGSNLSVTGTMTSTGNITGAAGSLTSVTTTGNGTIGGTLTVNKVSNISSLAFPAGTNGNDAALIEHTELTGNTGEMWIRTSDDWGGAGQAQDRIVFGNRATATVKHEFDATGNAEHAGDLVVGGAISWTCPTGMTRIGTTCIDNTRGAVVAFGTAMATCHNAGKSVCTFDDMVMCDELQPAGSTCDQDTNDSGRVLWTRTRHSERDDHDESWRENIMCYRGDDDVIECNINTETHDFYCCVPGVFSGTP